MSLRSLDCAFGTFPLWPPEQPILPLHPRSVLQCPLPPPTHLFLPSVGPRIPLKPTLALGMNSRAQGQGDREDGRKVRSPCSLNCLVVYFIQVPQ